MTDHVYTLPPDLPVPGDDHAADHLVGIMLPQLTLESSAGHVCPTDKNADEVVAWLRERA